ncbi:hypothetical protein [Flammeovirga aprica]|uniref:Uncharacterized protein n=1 Tax=Flammeovirga aprica JL-4 TaxID=694437 RepID=A0A7X9S1N9_9BACT|nr:hypothetical protein [Flammeovirga aprica]NME72755.1 hypothetical protein [Flammeovirga aprica JL-4]
MKKSIIILVEFIITFLVIIWFRWTLLPEVIRQDVVLIGMSNSYFSFEQPVDTVSHKAYFYKGFFKAVEILDKDSMDKLLENDKGMGNRTLNIGSKVYIVNQSDELVRN